MSVTRKIDFGARAADASALELLPLAQHTAASGHVPSMVIVGRCYIKGLGTKKNMREVHIHIAHYAHIALNIRMHACTLAHMHACMHAHTHHTRVTCTQACL